jgi:acetoin utilization deacetylase AcuC-like enzyme
VKRKTGPLGRFVRSARIARARGGSFLRGLGLPLAPRARLVYHPEYATHTPGGTARHAIDVWRADRIVEQLERAGVLSRNQLLVPEPVERPDLMRVHPEEFLDSLIAGETLSRLLFLAPGHGLTSEELLRPFMLQTGGTILAVERALEDDVPVFNLGGGFHHAQCDRAEGFCPVNDVAVAIHRLRQRDLGRRVLIVDLDYHQGNGSALIFSDDEEVFTLSVHGQSWSQVPEKQNHIDIELPPGTGDASYLAAVRRALKHALTRFGPDLVIYIAGADPHEDDDLGDFALTDDGMLDRDLYVFQTITEADLPLAVVLGGGYGSLAWTLHYNFIFSVLTGDRIDPAYRPGNIEAHYRRVKARLTPGELKAGAGDLSEDDLADLFGPRGGGGLFMDYYTRQGLETALERYGLLDMIRERGFPNLLLETNTDDPDRQIARVHYDVADCDHLLVELVMRFRTLVTPSDAVAEGAEPSYRMVSIEWLLMQNPRAGFSLERQRFPGQEHPGLGLGRWLVELLRMMAERLDCTGLMNIPQHYHNGYLYSKQMLCFHPEDQGYLEAMMRDLGRLPLVETSVAIDEGRLRNADTGEPVTWEGKPQVMPVKPELNSYFTRPGYIRAVAAARERVHFTLVDG